MKRPFSDLETLCGLAAAVDELSTSVLKPHNSGTFKRSCCSQSPDDDEEEEEVVGPPPGPLAAATGRAGFDTTFPGFVQFLKGDVPLSDVVPHPDSKT